VQYTVVVSNIGTVARTRSSYAAILLYEEYRDQSQGHYGRAGDEQVTLFADGEPVREYLPPSIVGDGEECEQEVIHVVSPAE